MGCSLPEETGDATAASRNCIAGGECARASGRKRGGSVSIRRNLARPRDGAVWVSSRSTRYSSRSIFACCTVNVRVPTAAAALLKVKPAGNVKASTKNRTCT